MPSDVATYYDRLGRWNRLARAIGYGGGSPTLTVHRALVDPAAAGRPTYTRLHDILDAQLPPTHEPRVLDAGCGLGGTMLALAQARDARCVGITLSASQAAAANAAAARMGIADRVHAEVGSYDAPPAGPFDVIVAIESLAHSHDPSRSVAALIPRLASGGYVVVVDDMPEPSAESSADLRRFKAGWQCPVLWPASAYRGAFARHGLALVRDLDLTGSCVPRSMRRIAQLMWLNRLAHLAPFPALRQVMDSHAGGLALERLIRRGDVRYRLLIAQKA
ncbi:MAG: methyltransferase domain-containing protein [Acidobacteria bacterium]|nr:methyltransferase domain-containing protein [Acidobacteriota bacterium]